MFMAVIVYDIADRVKSIPRHSVIIFAHSFFLRWFVLIHHV